jgi:hypothetical protein
MATSRKTFVYPRGQYQRNHVIWPGREEALKKFVHQRYGGQMHKYDNAHSANSEDALTWSCFDSLAQVKQSVRDQKLAELWKLAYAGADLPNGLCPASIHVGLTYGTGKEKTEVDASIEGPGALVFVEAKLYSPMSQAEPPKKPHNQIARKLRVGWRHALDSKCDFYFILLDLAPSDKLRSLHPHARREEATNARGSGFGSKWLTAYWFDQYKSTRRGLPLIREIIEGLPGADPARVMRNMGWLTWSDVFKVVLQAVIADRVL